MSESGRGGAYGVFNGGAVRAVFLPGAARGGGRLVAGRGSDGRLCACDGTALAYVPETARAFWDDRRLGGVMEIVRAGGVGAMSGGAGAVPMSDDAIDQILGDSVRREEPAAVVMPTGGADGRVWVGVGGVGECMARGAWVDGKYAVLIGGGGLAGGVHGGDARGGAGRLCVGLSGGNKAGQYSRVVVRDGVGGDVLLVVAAMVGIDPPSGAWGGSVESGQD